MNKIEYCIWDVGAVIYNYSLEPLHNWCEKNTSAPEEFKAKKGKFNYNNYMKGLTPFPKLCQEICDFYKISFQPEHNIAINKALHQGIGEYFAETRQMQEEMQQQGITNCILSNALPAIADDIKCADLIKKEFQFCSFELGLLKPDPAIYTKVKETLGCEFNQLIFIDDKPQNTAAAAQLGIHAITFNRHTIAKDIRNILPSLSPKNQNKSSR